MKFNLCGVFAVAATAIGARLILELIARLSDAKQRTALFFDAIALINVGAFLISALVDLSWSAVLWIYKTRRVYGLSDFVAERFKHIAKDTAATLRQHRAELAKALNEVRFA